MERTSGIDWDSTMASQRFTASQVRQMVCDSGEGNVDSDIEIERPQEKNSDFAKIREVTGIDDYQRIHKAIQACRNPAGHYEINEVINVLITQETVPDVSAADEPVSGETTLEEGARECGDGARQAANQLPPGDAPAANRDKGVIDLTSEACDSEQLQKAIAESLKDTPAILGGQLTREEQEISRVLEQSLQESKAGTKRKRGDLWFIDPLNPHERKRTDGWPVGLKNVGNTCWFSAVIQSLFHIPMFRQLVLKFVSPGTDDTGKSTGRRNVQFVCRLRALFALLAGTNRKYIDPSDAVEILKEVFSTNAGSSDNQQDVSEFQHRLLEWLEDAFRTQPGATTPGASPQQPSAGAMPGPTSDVTPGTTPGASPQQTSAGATSGVTAAATPAATPGVTPAATPGATSRASPQQSTSDDSNKEKEQSNPMVQLFYGQYMAEGVNEGKSFTKTETFGQFPLQVDGFKDLHSSLEGATAQGEIETVSMDVTSKSGQELWFTRLPLVLTFELSRFQFNQQTGCPEKIHQKLEFPDIIYMDRYMLCNKCVTRQKREEVKRLTENLKQLQARLDKFVNYGSGAKRFPLQQVLQYALEFAENRCPLPPDGDVEMESPRSQCSMVIDSPSATPPSHPALPPDVTMGTTPPRQGVPQPEGGERPSPKRVTAAELAVLQGCLQRWRHEVELNVKELQQQISQLEESIGSMYTDEQLQKYSYRLHAVLVHEGQAVSGHYWAYIYSRPHGRWLKFNDIAVTDASWAELWREGAGGGGGAGGGMRHTSAYCLMYVDSRSDDLFKDVDALALDDASQPANSARCRQAATMQACVAADNADFETEIAEWDAAEVQRRRRDDGTATAATATLTATLGEGDGLQVAAISERQQPPPQTAESSGFGALEEQHAQLAAGDTWRLTAEATESEMFKENGPLAALKEVCELHLCRLREQASAVPAALPSRVACLSHFPVYLLVNGAAHWHVWYALLQQVALLKADSDHSAAVDQRTREVRRCAYNEIERLRSAAEPQQTQAYQNWHTRYSQFRLIANAFSVGVEEFYNERYDEALPHLMFACEHNDHLLESATNPLVAFDCSLLRSFRRNCLLHVNEAASARFVADTEPGRCLDVMTRLVLPCLPALNLTGDGADQATIEDIRAHWCLFLNQQLEGYKVEKLQDCLSRLLEEPHDDTRPAFARHALHLVDTAPQLLTKYVSAMAAWQCDNSRRLTSRALHAQRQ